jgi:hypothetical protein
MPARKRPVDAYARLWRSNRLDPLCRLAEQTNSAGSVARIRVGAGLAHRVRSYRRAMSADLGPVMDEGLLDYANHCVAVCASEFGRPRETLPPPFELVVGGTVPEFRKLPGNPGTTLVILKQGCNVWQHRFQIGHEVTHWLITPSSIFPGIFHWTHEMLANEMSICCLRTSALLGAEETARQNEDTLRKAGWGESVEKVLSTKLECPPYDWIFGPAFRLGRKLQKAVGWDHVKMISTYFDDQGQPDLRGWFAALSSKRTRKAKKVLGTPHEGWV